MSTTSAQAAIYSRNEYLDQALRTATRIYWLAGWYWPEENTPLDPPESWLTAHVEIMRSVLESGDKTFDPLRWHCLALLGLPRLYASSSYAQEVEAASSSARVETGQGAAE